MLDKMQAKLLEVNFVSVSNDKKLGLAFAGVAAVMTFMGLGTGSMILSDVPNMPI